MTYNSRHLYHQDTKAEHRRNFARGQLRHEKTQFGRPTLPRFETSSLSETCNLKHNNPISPAGIGVGVQGLWGARLDSNRPKMIISSNHPPSRIAWLAP